MRVHRTSSRASQQPLDIAREQVDLEVERLARRELAERRDFERVRNEVDANVAPSTSLTVRLTPSSVTEPLRAM